MYRLNVKISRFTTGYFHNKENQLVYINSFFNEREDLKNGESQKTPSYKYKK